MASQALEKLPASLAENILSLVCFDNEAASIIRQNVPPESFSMPQHRRIIERTYEFYDAYQKVPGEVHLPDLLHDELEDKVKGEIYEQVLGDIFFSKGDVNKAYVLAKLSEFVRHQNMKASLARAFEAMKNDDINQVEIILQTALNDRVQSFDAGLKMTDKNALGFLDFEDNFIRLGIPELDNLGICPAPQELMTVVAPPGRGKTWFMLHTAKMALMQGKKVLYVSLEMSEQRIMQRVVQSLFSIAKRPDSVSITELERDDEGKVIDYSQARIEKPTSLRDANIKDLIRGKISKFRRANNFIVKEFPTRGLTINELTAYLNSLESVSKYVPDLMIIDYPDLFKLPGKDERIAIGNVYKELRGIAVKRHMAVVAASQTNRGGASEDAKTIDITHLAEDFSKAGISDNIITYNQTPAENARGLARLFVAKGRNDAAFQQILITQAYSIGQFCLDSYLMSSPNTHFARLAT